jgi:hypothetical protein
MNEDIAAHFFAAKHRENDGFSSRLDAVQIRRVTCEGHGHARESGREYFARYSDCSGAVYVTCNGMHCGLAFDSKPDPDNSPETTQI